MGVLTIRNVDDDVIVALKARARANHRSLEGELRYLLGRYAIRAPTLGLVRERARLAAAMSTKSTVRGVPTAKNVTDTAGQTAGTSGDTADTAEDTAGTSEETADSADSCADDRPDEADWLGAMSDVGEILGDIVSPAADPSDWDALRPETVQPKAIDGT